MPRAVQVIRECLEDPDERLAAAREILDRVYGKAPLAIDMHHTGQVKTKHVIAAEPLTVEVFEKMLDGGTDENSVGTPEGASTLTN